MEAIAANPATPGNDLRTRRGWLSSAVDDFGEHAWDYTIHNMRPAPGILKAAPMQSLPQTLP